MKFCVGCWLKRKSFLSMRAGKKCLAERKIQKEISNKQIADKILHFVKWKGKLNCKQ